jgi:hypothetical protein
VFGSVVTAVVLLALRDDGSDDDGRAADRPSATTTPGAAGGGGSGAGGSELSTLIRQGREVTFHAVYRAAPPPGSSTNQQLTLELWRKPPREREDLIQTSGGQEQRTSGFLLPPQSVICRQTGPAAPWTCANTSQALPDAEGLVKGLSEEVAGQASAGRDEMVGARPVRCFTVPAAGTVSDLCLTKEGITARVVSQGSRIELVDLSFDVPDDVFTLPAQPTG